MKMTIESTKYITNDPRTGVPCRVWRGRTEAGLQFWVFVRLMVAEFEEERAMFEEELLHQLGPGETIDPSFLL